MAAVEGGIGEPPGLARERRLRLRRSVAATGDMDGDGDVGGGGGGGGGGGVRYVLALPAMASLAVLIAHLDAAVPVPRRPRSYLPRAVPMAWWAFRLPVFRPPPPPPPPPAKNPVKEEEGVARVVVVVAPPPPVDPGEEEAGKRAAKRARRCLNCDAVETPQWRSGPMGRSTLCNACGVRLRAVGSLPEHRAPAARTTTAAPASPPDSPIWTPGHKPPSSSPDIYLVRRTPKLPVTRPPRTKQAPPTAPAPAPPPPPPQPASPKTKTKAKAKKPKRKRSCVHCGSTETPQWREGADGARHAVQRVRRAVQAREAAAGVPPQGEPHLLAVRARRQPPPGARAPPPAAAEHQPLHSTAAAGVRRRANPRRAKRRGGKRASRRRRARHRRRRGELAGRAAARRAVGAAHRGRRRFLG
uniref:GATA zinc finger family protein, expressed n=1 Tax=Oryza sativa subsp. japonica TaxID=39947 RepID=Q2QX57_ORYSJ|nr:GATA zinc finger family protein, expressed [Oryza sativa Japonica Group]